MHDRLAPAPSPSSEHEVTSSTAGTHSGSNRASDSTAHTAVVGAAITTVRSICFLPCNFMATTSRALLRDFSQRTTYR